MDERVIFESLDSCQSSSDDKVFSASLASVVEAILVRLRKLDFFIIDQLFANPLERLLRFDHVYKECSFKESMVVGNIFVEFLITTSDSGHDVFPSILNN
jgi:hypothetical protein